MQTNLSVQTVQTNCGGEVGGGICKSVITPAPNHTFAKSSFHLSPAVGLHGLHGEVGLHLIRCPYINAVWIKIDDRDVARGCFRAQCHGARAPGPFKLD